ncbi:hypothetical protein C8R47DRAFT_1240651 [Mycena vitilis]|nr:hypothetical protein C8R47DRAFT_1240651 [Mycena vitilis]
MAPKKAKKKSTASAARPRRSARSSRPPRRRDEEFSAVVVSLREPSPELGQADTGAPQEEAAALPPPLPDAGQNACHDHQLPDAGENAEAWHNAWTRMFSVPVLSSQRNFVIDPLGSHAGDMDPADPAADIIRQLQAIIPAGSTHIEPVEGGDDNIAEHMDSVLTHEAEVRAPPLEGIEQSAGREEAQTFSDDAPSVLYFIGIISAPGHATVFCAPAVPRPDHRIGIILESLVLANGPAGRTLEDLTNTSQFRVGFARVPEDITNDFTSFRNGFIEVGRLDQLTHAPEISARVPPARDSELRSALLASMGLDDSVSVFVVYVYPQNCFQNLSAIQPPSNIAPPGIQPASTVNPIERYLDLHYAARKADLRTFLETAGYQTAYKHCLIERQIMSVCTSLGIVFSSRQIVAAEVAFEGSPIHIRPDDIAIWMGISTGQFATCRTEVTAARAAHLLLRQIVLQENVFPPIEPRHRTFLVTLNSLMSGRLLPPVDPSNGYAGAAELQTGDVSAVRLIIASLKMQVADVKTLWGAQYQ